MAELTQVTLTLQVPIACIDHVIQALHRETFFMREVGLVSHYDIQSRPQRDDGKDS